MTQPSNRRLVTQSMLGPRRLGRVGARLVDGARPVRVPGANIYDLGLSDIASTGVAYLSDADIRARLDAAVAMGARLVRTHAGISAGHPLSIFPTQTSLRTGTPQEAAFLKLDRIVYEAGLRNLWLMIVLQDQHTPDYYHGNVVTFANMSLGTGTVPATTATIATYYSDATTLADTKAYNAAIYNRVNTLTGVTYANDNAVAIFETVNEGYSATAAWTQAILDHGRSICTATLFADGSNACDGRYPDGTDSTGTLAGYNSLTLARPADVMGSHLYDSNRMSLTWLNKAARMTAGAGLVHLCAEFGWTNVAQGLASPAETFQTTIKRADFLAGVETNYDIQGTMFWSLFAGTGNPPSQTHGDRFELCFPPTNAEQAAGYDELSLHAHNMNTRSGKPSVAPPTPSYLRGINISGAEFGQTPAQLPGTAGTDYFYPVAADFTYLASRGHKTVRLPIRWERVQPVLNGPLVAAEVSRITTALAQAAAAGIVVDVEVHNYARFINSTANGGATLTLGDGTLTNANLVDLWTKLAAALKGNSGLWGYGLMNEPYSLPGSPGTWTPTTTLYDFEVNATPWAADSATVARSTTAFHDGTASLAVTANALTVAPSKQFDANDGGNSTFSAAGGPTLAVWVLVPTGSPGTNWQAKFLLQDSAFVSNAGPNYFLTPGTWTQIMYSPGATLLGAHRQLSVQFSVDNPATTTAVVYVDTLQQGSLVGVISGSQAWQTASQAVVTAIRNAGDTSLIMVPGYSYSSASQWVTNHPTPWITDPANNVLYEAHYYFDRDNSGTYTNTYAAETTDATNRGYTSLSARGLSEIGVFTNWCATNNVKGFIGEFGWPNTGDTASWNAVGNSIYAALDAKAMAVTTWTTGSGYGTGYLLSVYTGGPLSVATSIATVVEAHLSVAAVVVAAPGTTGTSTTTTTSDGRLIIAAPQGSGGLDTGVIANGIATAKSRGGRQMIQLQPGIYSANPGSLLFDTDNVLCAGSGMGITEVQKTGNGDLFVIAPPTGDASVIQRVQFRDMRLNGNNFTGALVGHRFASQCHVRDVEFAYNQGIGLDMIRPWDTVIDSCLFDHVGPNDGTDASVHVRNSGATSGALFSASGQANMVTFRALRIESFRRALIIERGAGNTVDPYGFYVHAAKFETYYARGQAASVVNVRGVSLRDIDMSILGLDTGAAADVCLNWAPLYRSKLDAVRFNTNAGPTALRGIDSFIPATGAHSMVNISGEGSGFSDAMIRHNTAAVLDIKGVYVQTGVAQIGSTPAVGP